MLVLRSDEDAAIVWYDRNQGLISCPQAASSYHTAIKLTELQHDKRAY